MLGGGFELWEPVLSSGPFHIDKTALACFARPFHCKCTSGVPTNGLLMLHIQSDFSSFAFK